MKILPYATLTLAIFLTVISGIFSISGLVAIFPAVVLPIILMGSALELSKLVISAWLYTYWNISPRVLKFYLIAVLTVLVFIGFAGIFGYLSRAHLESMSSVSDIDVKIQDLDSEIAFKKKEIEQDNNQVTDLDKVLDSYYKRGLIKRGSKELEDQAAVRDKIKAKILAAQQDILKIEQKKNALNGSVQTEQLKIGPLRYVAELIFGQSDNSHIERAVRYLILLIVLIWDPLAISLVIASSVVFETASRKKIESEPLPEEETEQASLSEFLSEKIAETVDGKSWRTKTVEVKELDKE